MSKTKGNTVDPLGTIDELGADALRFALIHGTTPGNDQRFGPAKVENARNFANKLWNATRFVLGARPATDRRRRGAAPARTPPTSGRPTAGCCRAPPPPSRAVDRAMADFNFGEVTRLLYDAIWSEYCDWGLELAKVRLADDDRCRGRARGDLVGARRGARHVPAPAPPGDAVHHRAAVAGAAAPGRRPGPADRRPLAGRDGPRRDRRGRGRGARRARAGDPQRPRRREGSSPAAWLPLDVYVEPELGHALESLRPAIERLARGRPLRRHLTREDLHGTAGATGGPGRDRRPGRGDRRAPEPPTRPPPTPTARGSRRSSRTRSACSRRPAPGSRTRRSRRRRRRAIVERRARQRGRARGPGRAAARPARTMSRSRGRGRAGRGLALPMAARALLRFADPVRSRPEEPCPSNS